MSTLWIWFWLLFWAVGVILFGGFLTTDHWHQWQFLKRLPPSFGSTIGLILIAFGTLFSTYYWNELSTVQQRQSMLKALAHELVRNADTLDSWSVKDGVDQSKFRVYRRLNTSVLQAIISSGLLVDDEYADLFTRLSEINNTFTRLNNGLPIIETVFLMDMKHVENMRKGFEAKDEIHQQRQRIDGLVQLLVDKYGVSANVRLTAPKPVD